MIEYPQGYATPCREPHCGVLAVAIAAKVPFETAWGLLGRTRKEGAKWRGKTTVGEREAVLKELQVPFTRLIHVPADRYARLEWMQHPQLAEVAVRCSVATFAKRAKPGVTYMLQVARHVVTLRDGIVADQSGCGPAASHWTARKLVCTSTEIHGA